MYWLHLLSSLWKVFWLLVSDGESEVILVLAGSHSSKVKILTEKFLREKFVFLPGRLTFWLTADLSLHGPMKYHCYILLFYFFTGLVNISWPYQIYCVYCETQHIFKIYLVVFYLGDLLSFPEKCFNRGQKEAILKSEGT